MRILTVRDPEDERFLRKESVPVEKIDKKIKRLIKDMEFTLFQSTGIGLSAPQVGEHLRIFITTIPRNTPTKVFINPEIIWKSEKKELFNEGCLSIPELHLPVESHTEIKIKYLDKDGNEKIEHLTGLNSICAQHEIDHLNGKLFTDRFNSNKDK